jgi:Fe-S cluster assembly iron-binding protein IscA
MFTCSDDAATLIRSLVDDAELPDGSGLRLVLNAGTRSLMMSLAARPHAADEVHVHGDVCVFVASSAATRLDQQTLHAQLTGRRRTFYLLDG